jgi:Fic family protein
MNLIETAGKLRVKSVVIVKGSEIAHIPPSDELIKPLLENLFNYLITDDELLLIKSCVFHYELEFIHPFTDGNGRIGRLWQSMILKEYSPVFEFLPIETLIKQNQKLYYLSLQNADKQRDSTNFIEFMLEIIENSLEDLLKSQNLFHSNLERIEVFRELIGNKEFSRIEYLRHNKAISTATASRDLKDAVENGILEKVGEKRMTKYIFINNL